MGGGRILCHSIYNIPGSDIVRLNAVGLIFLSIDNPADGSKMDNTVIIAVNNKVGDGGIVADVYPVEMQFATRHAVWENLDIYTINSIPILL